MPAIHICDADEDAKFRANLKLKMAQISTTMNGGHDLSRSFPGSPAFSPFSSDDQLHRDSPYFSPVLAQSHNVFTLDAICQPPVISISRSSSDRECDHSDKEFDNHVDHEGYISRGSQESRSSICSDMDQENGHHKAWGNSHDDKTDKYPTDWHTPVHHADLHDTDFTDSPSKSTIHHREKDRSKDLNTVCSNNDGEYSEQSNSDVNDSWAMHQGGQCESRDSDRGERLQLTLDNNVTEPDDGLLVDPELNDRSRSRLCKTPSGNENRPQHEGNERERRGRARSCIGVPIDHYEHEGFSPDHPERSAWDPSPFNFDINKIKENGRLVIYFKNTRQRSLSPGHRVRSVMGSERSLTQGPSRRPNDLHSLTRPGPAVYMKSLSCPADSHNKS